MSMMLEIIKAEAFFTNWGWMFYNKAEVEPIKHQKF
jgi:hypothetical protein